MGEVDPIPGGAVATGSDPPRPASRDRRGREASVALAPFLPAVFALGACLGLTQLHGGYFARDWLPVAIALVALLVALAIARVPLLPRVPATRRALLALAAFAGWAYLSMAWADSPGSAWQAANKLLLYLVLAWLVALCPWTERSAVRALATWSLATGVVCLGALLAAQDAGGLRDALILGRWSTPLGYANGAAALAAMAFWPALLLSTRRALRPLVCVGLLVLAAFLLEFALLPQSRGATAALVLVAPFAVALAPDRVRLVARLAVLAGGLLVAVGPIDRVYTAATTSQPVVGAVRQATGRIGLSVLLVGLAGVALVALEPRIARRAEGIRIPRAITIGLVAIVALAGVGGAAAAAGPVADFTRDHWRSFNSKVQLPETTGARILGEYSDPGRRDYWRVALRMFDRAPVLGAGAGNFERTYTAERRLPLPSRFAHSIWLRALGEGGIVGAALLVAFLVLAVGAPLRGLRRLDPGARAVAVACAAVGAYVFAHASVDWLDEVPSVAGAAFAIPLIGVALVSRATGGQRQARAAERREAPGRGVAAARPWAVAVSVVVLLLALGALIPPYLSGRYVDHALATWRTDPARALRDLDRAASLNPLSLEPRITAGTLAVELRRPAPARAAFARSLRVEDNWYAHFELALLDAQAFRWRAAAGELARARALNRADPVLSDVARRVARRTPIDPVAVNRAILEAPLYKPDSVS